VVTLRAEIAEIKKKNLVAMGETVGSAPWEYNNGNGEEQPLPGQRGYRALVTVGNLDTDVSGLTPLAPEYQIAGGSSDITVVNLGDSNCDLELGDTIDFRTNYAAFLGLMNDPYIPKRLEPSLEEFTRDFREQEDIDIPRLLDRPVRICR
jgi:ornithine racemase